MVEQVRFERFLDAQPIGRAEALGLDLAASEARLRLVPFAALTAQDMRRWDELGQQAATASAYAQPWFMRQSLAHCDPAGTALLAILHDEDNRWLGVLPLIRANRIGRAPLPSWQAWSHPNRFVGTPLVRAGAAQLFWRGLLTGLSQASQRELALCLSDLALDDPVNLALFEVCAADERTMALDRRYARALLRPDNPPAIGAKQRRRLDLLARKLSCELGPPQFRLICDPAAITALLATFLDIERSGWKGAGGSAMACSEQNRSLFTAIVEDGATRGCCELAVLSVPGRVLALSSQLTGKGRSYGFKMAYDEGYAAYAPGLLLLDWLTCEHAASGSAIPIDSCAAPGQLPVSRLWHDRCELVDCRVALGGGLRRGAMQALLSGEIAYSALKRLVPGSARPLET